VVASIDKPKVDFELEIKDDGRPLQLHYSAIGELSLPTSRCSPQNASLGRLPETATIRVVVRRIVRGLQLIPDLNQMVPGTASRRGPNMPASKWLMEVDDWATERWSGAMDIVITGAVAGIRDI
jgi:hypothetical protein